MKQLLLICAVVALVGCGKKDEWPEFKTCERCKEADIKYWADVCKHCGKDPDGPNGVEKRAELMKIWLEEQRAENTEPPTKGPYRPPSKRSPSRVVPSKLSNPANESFPETPGGENAPSRSVEERFLAGELTRADYEKVKELYLDGNQLTKLPRGLEKLTQLKTLYLGKNQLTDVKGLENLTQLTYLDLRANPDLTKAQIDQLQKALPKCTIYSNPKK